MKPLLCFLFTLATGWVMAQTPKRLQVSDFKTSSSCQPCHSEIHSQWQNSTHSKAFPDPIYQVFLRRVSEKTGGRSNQFCVSCHAPLATVTGTVPDKLFESPRESALLNESVSCEFCHTISGSEVEVKKISLGAFLFPRIGQTKILYGRHEDAKTDAHATQRSSFLLSSELCGTCHRFAHPASGRVIQDTYAEWKQSPYARAGTRCQDCHMPPYAGKVAEGAKERAELHAHAFRGGHTDIIRRAASLNLTAQWKKANQKDALQVLVEVTNSGAGHLIPTGIPGIREMWVEITVFSGQQSLVTERRPLGLELFDEQKKPAMPWDAVSLGKDTRIQPKQTRREKFDLKTGDRSDLRVGAKLLERLVSQTAANYAGISPSAPLVMAEASTVVP